MNVRGIILSSSFLLTEEFEKSMIIGKIWNNLTQSFVNQSGIFFQYSYQCLDSACPKYLINSLHLFSLSKDISPNTLRSELSTSLFVSQEYVSIRSMSARTSAIFGKNQNEFFDLSIQVNSPSNQFLPYANLIRDQNSAIGMVFFQIIFFHFLKSC